MDNRLGVDALLYNTRYLPLELKSKQNWCCMKTYFEGEKLKKFPINPKTGEASSSNDLSTCASYEEALDYWKAHKKEITCLGFLIDDGLFFVDLDKLENRTLNETAKFLIKEFQSYTEWSISGGGIHIIGSAPKYGEKRRRGNFELYFDRRFVTLTGELISNVDSMPIPGSVAERTEEVKKFYHDIFFDEKEVALVEASLPVESNLEVNEIVELIRNSKNASKFDSLYMGSFEGYSSQSGADQALCNILAFYCGGVEDKIDCIFKQSGLYRKKWDRADYKKKTIEKAVARCGGNFYQKKKQEKLPDFPISYFTACLQEGEFGDADLFVRFSNKKWAWDSSQKVWYFFEDHWTENNSGLVLNEIRSTLRTIYATVLTKHFEFIHKDLTKIFFSKQGDLKTIGYVERIEKILKTEKYFGISGEEWDKDKWALGVKNGVIDLKTGAFRKQKPEDYIRKVCNASWEGLYKEAKSWDFFQHNIFLGEDIEAIVSFKQKLLGMGISGEVRDHVLPILYGEQGRNGKETEFETLKKVLGRIAQPVAKDVIMSSKEPSRGAPQPELYDLWGVRIAWLSETEENGSLNVSRVKHLSGGGTIKCRPLHGNMVEFEPTHTLFLFTNFRPHAPADDPALWERIILIKYPVRFCDDPLADNEKLRDPDIKNKLEEEKNGILSWLVRGCLLWQKEGLQIPTQIKEDTLQYKKEEDILGQFLDECCTIILDKKHQETYKLTVSELYKAYKEWATEAEYRPLGRKNFSNKIGKRLQKKEEREGVFFLGVSFKREIIYE